MAIVVVVVVMVVIVVMIIVVVLVIAVVVVVVVMVVVVESLHMGTDGSIVQIYSNCSSRSRSDCCSDGDGSRYLC